METDTDIRVKVTAEGQLELPAEIQAKLSPGDEYMVTITEAEIVMKKNPQTTDLERVITNIRGIRTRPRSAFFGRN